MKRERGVETFCNYCFLNLQDGEGRVRVEIHPVDVLDKHVDDSGSSLLEQGPSDTTPVLSFLSGKNCLHGVSKRNF